ncbi:MAG: exopolygalacturonase [Clostridia bacterium]|nr:exopolygalacturonase [Clostridia bacterium]
MRQEFFPDGTPMDAWFHGAEVPELAALGKPYVATEHGVRGDGTLQTEALQALIDRIAARGGGVLVIPRGTFLTGALFFRQGVNLYLEEGAVLLGSDDISDYPLLPTRIEGESCTYFAALINADGLDGFTICGSGVIDGNGLRAWKAFWLRRKWNPKCTNKDEQRARLVYLSGCSNVTVAGVTMRNPQFWTNHLYRCDHVRYLNVRITAPTEGVRAPSSDALDIDVCHDVLVKGCSLHVNDDSIVLKGGKGPWADTQPENGSNERVLIEDCDYEFCHGCLTCGSESVHDRNIILRNCRIGYASNLLWLKMRPDTPQRYEHIRVEGMSGRVRNVVYIQPWTQFFDLKGRADAPMSYADAVTLADCDLDCDAFFNVSARPDQYQLSRFTLRNLTIRAKTDGYAEGLIRDAAVENVNVTLVE